MGRQMRLDQYISTYVELTRKEAKEAIRRGLVCVAGTVVKQANCKIDSEEDVTYCGKEIRAEEFVYYMLNKPAGVVSATKDEKERTVLSLLPEMKRELFPMGRLDKDTVGLLILTDDGMLAHRLLSPAYHVAKVYDVIYEGTLPENAVVLFAEGLEIGERKKNAACKTGTHEIRARKAYDFGRKVSPGKADVCCFGGKGDKISKGIIWRDKFGPCLKTGGIPEIDRK